MKAAWLVPVIACLLAAPVLAETIELKDGEKLDGEVIERTDEVVVMEHPIFGRLEIPVSEIKPKEEVRPGLFGTSFLRGWTKNIRAGLNGAQGKSENMTINAGLSLKNQTEKHRDDFEATYYFSSEDGSTNDNQFRGEEVHDFLGWSEVVFPFVGVIYDYDAEQDWVHRLRPGAGVGFQAWKSDKVDLITRVGITLKQQWGDNRSRDKKSTECMLDANMEVIKSTCPKKGSDPEGSSAEALFSANLTWKVIDGQTFTGTAAMLPVLTDLWNFTSRVKGEYKIGVGLIEGLSFLVGSSFDYDSTVTGSSRRDFKYYGSLVYDF